MNKLLVIVSALLLGTLLVTSCSDRSAQGKHIVFIGDSITDGNWGCVYGYKPTSAERSHTDFNHIYGHSYMMLIASDFQAKHPEADYQFYNRGFSGHKLSDLEGRWQEDVLDLNPDVLSVLIGVNDMGNYFRVKEEGETPFDFDGWKERYRSLLLKTRERNPSVKLVLCVPFLAKEGSTGSSADYDDREAMVIHLAEIVRELSSELGATCVPFDTMFEDLIQDEPRPSYWIWDGVHPTPAGHRKMADLWEKKVKL
ncbi:MAG: SGNH/GDSL hydrolase family protein [Bacteroidales bacterium]|nr:SGNH/GDSL hydrolase family protein [Bacteroidales bacterium]